jgi:hypothetical protein
MKPHSIDPMDAGEECTIDRQFPYRHHLFGTISGLIGGKQQRSSEQAPETSLKEEHLDDPFGKQANGWGAGRVCFRG